MEPTMQPKSEQDLSYQKQTRQRQARQKQARERLARGRAKQAYSPERLQQDEELDEGLVDSFPASDPVSISQPSTAMPAFRNRRRSDPDSRT
jgi:hypothetical protein